MDPEHGSLDAFFLFSLLSCCVVGGAGSDFHASFKRICGYLVTHLSVGYLSVRKQVRCTCIR